MARTPEGRETPDVRARAAASETNPDPMVSRILLPVLVALFALSGCRTYGGHGSEAGAFEQIARIPEWSAQENARLAGDLQALDGAASRHPEYGVLARRLADLAVDFDAASARWSQVAANVDREAPYRVLNRTLGALVAERQAWEDGYRRLAEDVAGVVSGVEPGPRPSPRYQVAPVYYERFASRLDDVRIRDLLATVR